MNYEPTGLRKEMLLPSKRAFDGVNYECIKYKRELVVKLEIMFY